MSPTANLPMLLDRVLLDPLALAGSGRAIGYLGWDVPVELILAAGAAPVQLNCLVPTQDTALADRYLENSFSAPSRAVAQKWLSGALDDLTDVVFSRGDDSAQRLYYYLCELQRFGECKGPRPLLYDLARIGRASSVTHTMESTQLLAASLGVDESRLDEAIERVSSRLNLLDQLGTLRASENVPSGRLANRILRAALTDWSEQFDSALRSWLAAPVTMNPRKRVLLVGSVPADEQLHAAVETDEIVVVGEINETTAPWGTPSEFRIGDDRSSRGIEAAAHRCYRRATATRALLQSPAKIVTSAKTLHVDGVILWMLATDTGLAWQAPRIEQALKDAKLPALMLTSQPQTLNAAALDQIARFRSMLEAM